MDLQDVLQEIKRLIAENDIEAALGMLDHAIGTYTPSFNNDCVMLRNDFNAIKRIEISGRAELSYLNIEYNKIAHRIVELVGMMKDGNSQKLVIASDEGTLMHNIPDQMPINTKTRCTIRIGILKEALLQNFENVASAKLEEIMMSKKMRVELMSLDTGVFEILTVNLPEQYINLKKNTQWQFDVIPCQIGIFSLYLKVSAILMVYKKESYYEHVFDIAVKVTTVEMHLKELELDGRGWKGIGPVGRVKLLSPPQNPPSGSKLDDAHIDTVRSSKKQERIKNEWPVNPMHAYLGKGIKTQELTKKNVWQTYLMMHSNFEMQFNTTVQTIPKNELLSNFVIIDSLTIDWIAEIELKLLIKVKIAKSVSIMDAGGIRVLEPENESMISTAPTKNLERNEPDSIKFLNTAIWGKLMPLDSWFLFRILILLTLMLLLLIYIFISLSK